MIELEHAIDQERRRCAAIVARLHEVYAARYRAEYAKYDEGAMAALDRAEQMINSDEALS